MKHWVTSSCNNSHVRLFDSRQQQGVVDCGLFAIAYAVYLANDIDPFALLLHYSA